MRDAVRSPLTCLPALRLAALTALIGTPACGGSSQSAANAKSAASATPNADNVSIGDVAVAQGGLDALGGGRNRSAADQASSMAGGLQLGRVDRESPVKVDGTLREWPARTSAKTVVQGDASKTAFAVALQADDARLYVGADVGDDAFMRTSLFKDTEDHAVLTIAFPIGGGGLATYEIGLFAGEPGESTGVVRFASGARRGQDVPGAKIVEATAQGGYSFEASIPWSTFPEARTTRVGLRGSVRYVDADAPNNVRAIVGTSNADAAHASTLPPLPTDSEQAVVEQLLVPKGLLGTSPKFDIVADVAGDAMKERIVVYGSFVTICGPRYRDGKSFFFRDTNGEVVRVDARQVTGRAKDDLLVTRRYELGGSTRSVFEVWSVLRDADEPQTVLAHEIGITSGQNRVDDAVHVSGRDVEIATDKSVGWDVSTYREPTSSDVEPLLLPWGGVKSQTFRFAGARFAKVHEVTQTPAPGPPPTPGAPQSDAVGNTLADARKDEPATPAVAKGGDLSADVLAAFKRDHGLAPNARPRFDLSVHVGGDDERPERIALFGRELVVLGPGFKGGTQYVSLTLSQFPRDEDVHEVSARDLTGDGAADIVVRGAHRVSAKGQRTPVEVESIFVYQMDSGDRIARIFGIETGRSVGKKRVQGLVQFVPSDDHKSFEIDAQPGIVRGWTKSSYPWPQEQGGGALEPLLLPWGGVSDVRYAWDGGKFAAKN